MSTPRKRPAEQVIWQGHPSWKGMLGWYVQWTLIALVQAGLVYAAHRYGGLGLYWVALDVIVAATMVWGIGKLIRRATTYQLTTLRVRERTGIIRDRWEQAQLSHIVNVRVERSVFERMFGIGRIDFDTAAEQTGMAGRRPRSMRGTDFLCWWGVADVLVVEQLAHRLMSGDLDPLDLDTIDEGIAERESDAPLRDWTDDTVPAPRALS